jgi:enoyl-CoA hydratase
VERVHHDALLARLAEGEDAERAISGFAVKPAPSPLQAQAALIDTIFAATSVERVLERLEREGGAFAGATAQILRTRSPTALKLAFHAQRRGRALNLADCLKMEYRVVLRAAAAHDFQDGVRALLIDKNQPRWQPASLAGVGDDTVSAYFETLSGGELAFG